MSTLCWNLGKWIGNPDDDIVRDEYEEMGRVRFREGVPVSELVYALLLTKQHLRRYIRDYALVDFAGDRVVPDELLPVELQSVQELNYQVGEFFDRALYHLARGYELENRSAWSQRLTRRRQEFGRLDPERSLPKRTAVATVDWRNQRPPRWGLRARRRQYATMAERPSSS